MVKPLSQCVARPDEDGRKHLLIDHLVSVAHAAGDPLGEVNERLGFLSGLLHDAAKCHEDWQDYIDPETPRKKGPPHSPMGAALFCYTADTLISKWCESRTKKRQARNDMLNWIIAIQGHHGRLEGFSAAMLPWLSIGSRYTVSDLINGCDLNGVFDLARRFFPSFDKDAPQFAQWLENYDKDWLDLVEYDRKILVEEGDHHRVAMRFPQNLGRLIAADRNNAGQLPDDFLARTEARQALNTMAKYCKDQGIRAINEGVSEELVKWRSSIQDQTAATYLDNVNNSFYTLLLPTGYGKTLTALRVALEACATGRCQRIIYVAPYISILSQATHEISEASGLKVFEHHHLSLAKRAGGKNTGIMDPLSSERSKDPDDDFDVLDTWKAPVIATTFNQFFRALFPRRAQHALRIEALFKGFVIIDEPQIIDIGVWNVFLRALEVFADQHQCQVVFSTATLPPLETGLQSEAVAMAPSVPSLHRYDIVYQEDDCSQEDLEDKVQEILDWYQNVAVVMNTVRDAYLVFKALREGLDSRIPVYCLTAMMLPGHKHRTIRSIRDHLERQKNGDTDRKLVVICTQILEAGVNLSFRAILRARSLFPSIAQVAGRANRHNEGETASIYVFPFKSEGGKELRDLVYRDPTARRMTDRMLAETPLIAETQVLAYLAKYYEDCWRENSQSALLGYFQEAALGDWSRLANLEPFGLSLPKEEIFVPVPLSEIDSLSRPLVQRFATGADQLMEKYLDKDYQRGLGFHGKKLFRLAHQQFLVPTRRQIAEQVASEVNNWLWQINDPEHYSTDTGLAHWLDHQERISENELLMF